MLLARTHARGSFADSPSTTQGSSSSCGPSTEDSQRNTPTMALKLSYADETRRVVLGDGVAPLTFEALGALVAATFPRAPRSVALVYTDDEGDIVTLASARELAEAQRVFATALGGRTLHVRVLPRVGVKEQLPPAVMHAVDELSSSLVRLASGTRDFLESARTEISQRLRDVHARIAGEFERRRSSMADDAAGDEGVEMETRRSEHSLSPAIEYQAVVQESAAPAVSASVLEEAAEQLHAVAPEAPLLQQAPALEEEVPYESDAETIACSSSDEDCDDDDDDDGDDSDGEWAVVPDVWSAEVALVRTILPHVHVEDCVAMLRKHGGDLAAAIDELTDS